MAKYIIILLALVVAFLDYKAYKKLVKNNASTTLRKSFISIVSFFYIILLSSPIFMFTLSNEQNNRFMMILSMIILTAYIVFAITRIIFYIFWLPAKNKYWTYTGIVLSLFTMVTFLYGIFITRTDYEVKNVKVSFNNIPESFNGYKIAFISDIHIGSMLNVEEELRKVVELINDSDADILLFGGDLVNIYSSELNKDILDILSTVKCPDGVFAVLGNHDTGAYTKEATPASQEQNRVCLSESLSTIGWVMLRDSTVYIKQGSDSIAVTGIDYSDELLEHKHSLDVIDDFDVSKVYNNVPDETFNITISHLPQLWKVLYEGNYSDFTLSGHIHAMQIKYFSLSPAMFLYSNWSGLYENSKGKQYITDGIGSVAFMARFGARPEITLIELCKE